jgi:hypothetical protein
VRIGEALKWVTAYGTEDRAGDIAKLLCVTHPKYFPSEVAVDVLLSTPRGVIALENALVADSGCRMNGDSSSFFEINAEARFLYMLGRYLGTNPLPPRW